MGGAVGFVAVFLGASTVGPFLRSTLTDKAPLSGGTLVHAHGHGSRWCSPLRRGGERLPLWDAAHCDADG